MIGIPNPLGVAFALGQKLRTPLADSPTATRGGPFVTRRIFQMFGAPSCFNPNDEIIEDVVNAYSEGVAA